MGPLTMKCFAMTVNLRDDPNVIRQYDQYHANPWREVTEGLRRCGVQRLFIHRFERQLFLFMETGDEFDLERDMPRYMEHPRAREWDEMMQQFQEPVPGAPPDATWVQMKRVFSFQA